jgi:hypothetical protein
VDGEYKTRGEKADRNKIRVKGMMRKSKKRKRTTD